MRDQHIRLVEGGGMGELSLIHKNFSRSNTPPPDTISSTLVEQATMATAIATLLSTTWTNPCGNTPVWTGWATPTIGPAAPTLFWADYQPSSCYPPAFSAMSWGNATYSPGVCPYGYTTATSTFNLQNQETDAVCCQS